MYVRSWNPYEAPRATIESSFDGGQLRRTPWLPIALSLSVLHLFYATCLGLLIYVQRGESTWINSAWLPGGLLLAAFGQVISPHPLASLGWLLLPTGSLVSGIVAARAICDFIIKESRSRFRWRYWLALLLWLAWIPVPFQATIFYWIESY
jgi:hypothetical protein